jgi:AcrR family transcriptional regulator
MGAAHAVMRDNSWVTRPGRADARATRLRLLEAAAELLRADGRLTMRAVAAAGDVSRSTLYRHFPDTAAVQQAVREEAVARATRSVERSLAAHTAPLAQLRAAVTGLVDVGRRWPLEAPAGTAPADAARRLRPLGERLAILAGLDPLPADAWLEAAATHLVLASVRAGAAASGDPGPAVDALLRRVTEPLDRGIVLLDARGAVQSLNRPARAALAATAGPVQPGQPVVAHGGLYPDGMPAPADAHPLAVALASGHAQRDVRGYRGAGARTQWYSIRVDPLRAEPDGDLYGFVMVFVDVSEEKEAERRLVKPPGELAARDVPLLDVLRVLDEVPPPLLPEQLVAEATRLAGGPVALYVVDIDGSHLLRLAGREDFPERLRAPLALGPEIGVDGIDQLLEHVRRELPGAVLAPMWLRGRAVGVLLALRGAKAGLAQIARLGAAAMELANGYTDVFDAARRRKDVNPAAEIQQSLIPPRIARVGGGRVAGSVMPSYDVGGDWFDYVENRDGAWISIADAAGRGPRAAAYGSVALAALRAARRNRATLEGALQTMHETVSDVGGPEFFVTAIVARWDPLYSLLRWVNCGHPPPLLIRRDHTVEELDAPPQLPLGVFERTRRFQRRQRRLGQGERVVLYSDGVSGRKTADGPFGTAGIARAAASAPAGSATATVKAIQQAVAGASEDPLPDDAAVVVLAVTGDDG